MNLASFGWKTAALSAPPQVTILQQAAAEVISYADNATGGRGFEWMNIATPGLAVHLGGLPQWVVTKFNGAPTSLVFPKASLWLVPDFEQRMNPVQHVVHELGHVVDNRLSGRFFPATFFGGGPADELVRFAGGSPRGLRFRNGTCGIQAAFLWPAGTYGNSATAEYFAEIFAHAIFKPDSLPNPGIKDWLDWYVFQKVL